MSDERPIPPPTSKGRMSETDAPRGAITVSRDALRAELLELELRLTQKLNESLTKVIDPVKEKLTDHEVRLVKQETTSANKRMMVVTACMSLGAVAASVTAIVSIFAFGQLGGS